VSAAASAACLLRDRLGSYNAAWYGAGALAVLASLLSLMLFAGKRLKPIAPGIGLVVTPSAAQPRAAR
jgi:hypothetical protein